MTMKLAAAVSSWAFPQQSYNVPCPRCGGYQKMRATKAGIYSAPSHKHYRAAGYPVCVGLKTDADQRAVHNAVREAHAEVMARKLSVRWNYARPSRDEALTWYSPEHKDTPGIEQPDALRCAFLDVLKFFASDELHLAVAQQEVREAWQTAYENALAHAQGAGFTAAMRAAQGIAEAAEARGGGHSGWCSAIPRAAVSSSPPSPRCSWRTRSRCTSSTPSPKPCCSRRSESWSQLFFSRPSRTSPPTQPSNTSTTSKETPTP